MLLLELLLFDNLGLSCFMFGGYCQLKAGLYGTGSRVFTRGFGLVGNPVTPYDVIRVYTKMNENFNGGINNVMISNNDPVDSRHLQRCADNGHQSVTHASVRGKPIREKGRFRCVDTLIGRSITQLVSSRLGTSGSTI